MSHWISPFGRSFSTVIVGPSLACLLAVSVQARVGGPALKKLHVGLMGKGCMVVRFGS